MDKSITLIDNTTNILNKIQNKINYTLSKQKEKLAYKYFDSNQYIQNYIKHFYNNFEDSFFEDEFLIRFNSFDFSQIPANLHEELKTYMQEYYCLQYYTDDYYEGFTIGSFENIYINDDNEIFADFTKKSLQCYTDSQLELFLKLEKIMSENGIYPDIVFLDYYGQYSHDYEIPKEYEFLKTAQKENETTLKQLINELIEIFDIQTNENWYNYRTTDNEIISDITPNFIQEIENNIDVEITEVLLSDNFDLHIQYNIPTQLKESDLKKLNITDYTYNKSTIYNKQCVDTIINIDVNIKDWLKKELA